jgi:YVTN family beta-propeller protein
MRFSRLGMAILLAVAAVGCGSNSTTVGITISPAGPLTIIVNQTQQLSATVTGIATTTVYWQICLPAASTTVQPTVCTPVPGVTIGGQTVLTGYGTITQTGLYTAPSEIPAQNSFVVMASSTSQTTTYNIVTVSVDTGIRVQVNPTDAVIGTGETFQFTATVTGTTNSAVTWQANGTTGGDATDGYICPNSAAPIQPCSAGEYEAPVTTPSSPVTIEAVSAADPAESGSATVSVAPAINPALTSVDPLIVAEGSAQQDVYLTGSSFFSTSTVLVNGTPVPTVFIDRLLLRGTIPASLLTQAGNFPVEVQSQDGGLSSTTGSPVTISVVPERPAIVASTPDSVSQSSTDFSVNLTGGYFLNGGTTATFNGSLVSATYVDSRHMSVTIPSASTPGLYPIVLQNCETPTSCVAATSAVNLAVTPNPANIPTSPIATVRVGSNPSAVDVDPVLGLAAVANQGSGTVSLIDLNLNQLAGTVTVGNGPTGVAIDDQLPHHLALVVNSADETVSTIDLATQAVTSVLPVSIGPLATSPVPYSIGINPMTHRGIVTYQSTNQALIIDLVTPNPGFTPSCSVPPCPVALLGGNYTQYATGMKPAVAVDPSANWAMVTPGGSGTINLVDLGRAPDGSAGDQGRVPEVIGNLSYSQTVQGVGLNLVTHQALLTDPSGGKLTSYSLLDNSVNTISFTQQNGITLSEIGFVAAAANPLENIGIAINAESAMATVVDLETGNVLQTASTENGTSSAPQAVAIDPGTNEAVIANQDGTVSILSLGPIRSPQIVDVNPAITYTSQTPLTLRITGAGFDSGASVFLDGIPITAVTTNGRQIVATVPADMLSIARRYAVTVENPSQTPTTNAADLAVIQAIPVGNIPVGVAVDTDRDVAVVTNSGDTPGDVSLVALTPTALVPDGPIWPIGPIGPPISVGTDPLGVAVLPRTGSAVVANFGSNNASIVDVSGINSMGANAASIPVPLCSGCYGTTGVGMNQDSGIAVLTNSTSTSSFTGTYYASLVTVSSASNSSNFIVDQLPTAVATDPNLGSQGVAAIASSQTNTLDLVDMTSGVITRASDLSSLPTGVVFDPLNQVFLVAASLGNNIVIVDPSTDIELSFRVGTNPTSVDYNFQTSTIVTVNSASQTMSVVDYVCPPSGTTTACSPPKTRMVMGVAGSQVSSSLPVGPNSVAIDPKLNLAVLVDTTNNRILLIPLPH